MLERGYVAGTCIGRCRSRARTLIELRVCASDGLPSSKRLHSSERSLCCVFTMLPEGTRTFANKSKRIHHVKLLCLCDEIANIVMSCNTKDYDPVDEYSELIA